MVGDNRFWLLFGGLWLLVGGLFVVVSLGIMLIADPASMNKDLPVWAFTLVGLAACAAGGFVIMRSRKTAAHDRRLMESGKPLGATVVEIRLSPIRINREQRWHVVYRYEDGGRTLQGQSRMLDSEDVEAFKPGDRVRIQIDPLKPEDSLFLGAA